MFLVLNKNLNNRKHKNQEKQKQKMERITPLDFNLGLLTIKLVILVKASHFLPLIFWFGLR